MAEARGRNVLVTGASRGLGLAVARRLATDGFRVLAVARTQSPELQALAADVAFTSYDLSELKGLGGLVRALRAEHGPIFGLINNAGSSAEGLLATMPDSDIERLLRVNALSPLILTKYVVRGMLSAGEGRIVNISSITATTGSSGLCAYGASKAALIGLTKSLAREVGGSGITVNALAPGFIETDLTASLSPEARERVARRSALKRLATPADVAAAVSYLLGPGAGNVTGAVLTIDAGATA